MLDKWQAWIALAVGILTVLTLTLALWHSNNPEKQLPTITSQQQVFAGSVWGGNNEPLPGVRVSILLNEKILASGPTDNLGRYTFRVSAWLKGCVFAGIAPHRLNQPSTPTTTPSDFKSNNPLLPHPNLG